MNGSRTFTVSFVDFPKIVKSQKDSRVLETSSVLRGLIDLGNSSYMNSCVTVLFFQAFLESYFSHISHIDMSNSVYRLIMQLKNDTAMGQLGNPRKLKDHLTGVLKQYEDEHPHDAYNVTRLLTVVYDGFDHFNTKRRRTVYQQSKNND